MLNSFGLIPAFVALGVVFIFITLVLSHVIAPNRPGAAKNSTYECGEPAVGSAWFNFNMRFYAFALTFVVFDIELAVIYPLAVLYREAVLSGEALTLLVGILVFAGVLFLGLIALFAKGDLAWSKDLLYTGTATDVSMRDTAVSKREGNHADQRNP